MLRWVLLSVILHALVLLIFIDILPSTVSRTPPGQLAAMHAVLQQKPAVPPLSPVVATSEIKPRLVAPKLAIAASNTYRPSAEKAAPVTDEPAASAATSTTVAVDREAQIGEPRANPVVILSQDSLREYRLNLSREARRYKRYPALARQRGLEGVVVVVVSTRAGLALPQLSLSRSSGEEVLDQQAMEMLNLAVRAASVPESLRGRDFAIDLAIHFSLDE